MKRAVPIVFAVSVFFVFALTLFFTPLQEAQAADTIKIGHVCSITGWAGMLGSPQRDAMLAMVEDLNKKGGLLGKQIEIFIEDDKSQPTTAVIAATKLIRDVKVNLIVGTTLNDSAQAIIPIVEQEQVPMVCTAPVVVPFKKWVFYVGPGDQKMAVHVVELAIETFKPKKIALLHDTALYGVGGAKIINKELTQFPGVSIVITEKYEPGDTNMVPQLTKIKAANPDLLIIYGTGAGPAVVAKNYKQLGLTIPVVGGGGLGAPDFVKVGGPIAEESKWAIGVLRISVAESLSMNDPYRKNVYEPMKKIFQNKFGAEKGASLNVFHVSPMDAIVMASMAIKAANTDNRAAVRDALEKVKFEGLLGNVGPGPADHFEGAKDTSILGMLKGGQFVPFTK
jgi:branched-chain amino acid transport system substrate-binding protein